MRNFVSSLFVEDSDSCLNLFVNDISDINCDNFNVVFDSFVKIFKNVFDKNAPLKTLSRTKTKYLIPKTMDN